MKKLTRQEKHAQCIREIRATLIVVAICCAWHITTAFALNGSGLYFLGMPAWLSVSVFGTIVLALAGVWILLKFVFINFEYEDEENDGEEQ
ncbi:MAG: YhdT family protein [Eubacterium sp.]|jgi:uncharacterized membrane protein YhdT